VLATAASTTAKILSRMTTKYIRELRGKEKKTINYERMSEERNND
jgi:hypothetical protein